MNTTDKGNKFEDRARRIVDRLIDDGQIGHLREFIRIKRKEGYYSKKRESNITFDLTIEFWPPGASNFSILYVVECKNYDKRIPVDEVEVFCNQLQQLDAFNVKGIIISNAPLQKGGDNIAKNSGIMVVEGESEDNFKIVYYRTTFEVETLVLPYVIKPGRQEEDEGMRLVAKIIDKELLNCLKKLEAEDYVGYNIDKLSEKEIQSIAEQELNDINSNLLAEARELTPQILKEYIGRKHNIKIVEIDDPDFLGLCNLGENEIGLNKRIIGTNRELFTLAHEYGHYCLHQKLTIGQKTYDEFEDPKNSFRTGKPNLQNPKNWIEWQANCFAVSLALPKSSLMVRLHKFQDHLKKSHGKILLNADPKTQKLFFKIIKHLSHYFNVSNTTIIIGLKELSLINDQLQVDSIGKIIDDYEIDYFV